MESGIFQKTSLKYMILFSSLLLTVQVRAQSQEKIYSHLILNLSRGILWPSTVSSGNFVIGVLEYGPLASELANAAGVLKIGSRKVEIKELTGVDDVKSCNVLFIPAYKAKALAGVLTKLGTYPTLIITNKMDMARKGSGVNFLLVDGKLKYEINCKSIEDRGMKISASIKGMGIVINQ
jgi:hypothetical protein